MVDFSPLHFGVGADAVQTFLENVHSSLLQQLMLQVQLEPLFIPLDPLDCSIMLVVRGGFNAQKGHLQDQLRLPVENQVTKLEYKAYFNAVAVAPLYNAGRPKSAFPLLILILFEAYSEGARRIASTCHRFQPDFHSADSSDRSLLL